MSDFRAEELKGKAGGNCNVTACQRPGAYYYNRAMYKYYCEDCAHDINRCGPEHKLFPELDETRKAVWELVDDLGRMPTFEEVEACMKK